ncbi:hypothetical protein ES703_117975 [subsurface metagenome]
MVGYGVNRYRIRAIQVYGYISVDAVDIITYATGDSRSGTASISHTGSRYCT